MKFLEVLRAFLRPANIINIPAGQQGVDATGANALIALMANANNAIYGDMASYATTGNSVSIAAGDIATNPILVMSGGASAPYNINLPSTSAILAALGPSVPQDGSFSKIISILPQGAGQTGTLVAGDAPTSIVGAAVIGSNVCRSYVMRVLGSGLSFTNIGFNFV